MKLHRQIAALRVQGDGGGSVDADPADVEAQKLLVSTIEGLVRQAEERAKETER